MRFDRQQLLLYAVTDRSWLKEGETLLQPVEQALRGGATMIQLREKELDREAFLREARAVQALCRQYRVPFLINDAVDIAWELDADGVHVGQEDLEAGLVRERLGPDKIVGVSAHTVEEARLAESRGADYLGVGAVFSTSTKLDAGAVALDTLREICAAVSIPVVAIGGISAGNLDQLAGTGIAGAAVVSAVFAQPDIRAAASALRARLETMVNGASTTG